MGTPDAGTDPKTLLLQKEQELARLRETALSELEAQLQTKNAEYRDLQDKFEQLRSDFEYNLGLLSARDDELHQYEQDIALKTAVLGDRDRQLAELQASYDETYQALKSERAVREEEACLAQVRVQDLQRQLDDQRASSAEALRKLREQHEQGKRGLQRAVAEAEEALARQRREMASEFTTQAQELELKYRQETEDAKQEARVARALADQRANEVQSAHTRELQQIQATEASVADARRWEQKVKALTFELDSCRKLKDDAISDLTLQNSQLKHQLKVWTEEADAQRSELSQRLSSAHTELDDLRSAAESAAALATAQHEEEVAMLRQRLEQAQASVNSMAEELTELRTSFKVATKQLQDKLHSAEQARRKEREEQSEQQITSERQHKTELREAREQLWAREEEVRVLRDKLTELRQTLDERRSDIQMYRDQVVAAGERERELQRRVLTAELRVEDLGSLRELTQDAQQDQLVRTLAEQRDAANAALQDAAKRLLDKEVEILSLRDALAAATSPAVAAAAMQQATAAAAAARVGIPPPSFHNHSTSDMGQQILSPRLQRITPLAKASGPSERGQPQQSQAGPPQPHAATQIGTSGLTVQVSQDSMPDLPLPSPLTDVPVPSTQSSAAFWAALVGSRAGSAGGAGPGSAVAAAAGAAAARAAAYLRMSRDEIDTLLRARGDEGGEGTAIPTTSAAPASPRGLALVASLRSALYKAEAQNTALRGALGVMREEMEALQQAAAAAAAVAASTQPQQPPAASQDDIAAAPSTQAGATLLIQELQESDTELQQAMQHIRILQQQLDKLYAPAHPHRTHHTHPTLPPTLPTPTGTTHIPDPTTNETITTQLPMQAVGTSGLVTISSGGAVMVSGTGPAELELSYLRTRVERLVLEVRQLRREALQLRMAATMGTQVQQTSASQQGGGQSGRQGAPHGDALLLGAEAAEVSGVDGHGRDGEARLPLGPHMTQDVSTSSQAQGSQQQAQQATNPTSTIALPDDDNESLTARIEELEQTNESLRQQNDQLMDLSNELRAERDRLQARLVSAGLSTQPANPYSPPWPQHPPQQPPTTDTAPAPQHPYELPHPPQAPDWSEAWPGPVLAPPAAAAQLAGASLSSSFGADAAGGGDVAAGSGAPYVGPVPPGMSAEDMGQALHSVHRYVVSRLSSPRIASPRDDSYAPSDGDGSPHGALPRGRQVPGAVGLPSAQGAASPPRSRSAGPAARWQGAPRHGDPAHVQTHEQSNTTLASGVQGAGGLPQVVGMGLKLTQVGPSGALLAPSTPSAGSREQATPSIVLHPPTAATTTSALHGFVTDTSIRAEQGGSSEQGFGDVAAGHEVGSYEQGRGHAVLGTRAGPVSMRETASQRSTLQSLQKRHERLQKPLVVGPESVAAKVRNWNVRHDDDDQEHTARYNGQYVGSRSPRALSTGALSHDASPADGLADEQQGARERLSQCYELGFVCAMSGTGAQLDVDSPFEWNWRSIVAIVIVLVVGSLANSAGVGGGAIFVPVLQAVVGFGLKEATAVSQALIAAGGFVSVFINLFKRNPYNHDEPLINFSVALALIPVVLAGVAIGVILNTVFPAWLITILLLLLMLLLVYQSVHKGVTLWKRETALKQEIEIAALENSSAYSGQQNGQGSWHPSLPHTHEPSRPMPMASSYLSWDCMEGTTDFVTEDRVGLMDRTHSDASGRGLSYDCMEGGGAHVAMSLPVTGRMASTPGRQASLSRALKRLGSGVLRSPAGIAGQSDGGSAAGESPSKSALEQPLLGGYDADTTTQRTSWGSPAARQRTSDTSLGARRPARVGPGQRRLRAVGDAESVRAGRYGASGALAAVPEDTEQQSWVSRRSKWRAHMFEIGELGQVPQQGQSLLQRALSRHGSGQSSRRDSAGRLPTLREDTQPAAATTGSSGELQHPLQAPPPDAIAARLGDKLALAPKVVNMRLPPVQPPLPKADIEEILSRFDSYTRHSANGSHATPTTPANQQQRQQQQQPAGPSARAHASPGPHATPQPPTHGSHVGVQSPDAPGTAGSKVAAREQSGRLFGRLRSMRSEGGSLHATMQQTDKQTDATVTGGPDFERLSSQALLPQRAAGSSGPHAAVAAAAGGQQGTEGEVGEQQPAQRRVTGLRVTVAQAAVYVLETIKEDLLLLPGWTILAIAATWVVFSGLQVGRSLVAKCSPPYWALLALQLSAMIAISVAYAIWVHPKHNQHPTDSESDTSLNSPTNQTHPTPNHTHAPHSTTTATSHAGNANGANPSQVSVIIDRDNAETTVSNGGGTGQEAERKLRPVVTTVASPDRSSAQTSGAKGGDKGGEEEDFTLGSTMAALALTLSVGCLAGVVGGLLGLGGGMLIGPLLLQLGAHPQVSAASSSLMVLFSSSAAVVGFVVLDRLNVQYSLVLGAASGLASILGVLFVSDMIRRTGRTSLVVFSLSLVMLIALGIIVSFGSIEMAQDFKSGKNIGFHSMC